MPLTDEDRAAILSQERLVAEILRIRGNRGRWWESAAVVAILTVGLSSFFGLRVQRSVQDFQLKAQRADAEVIQRRSAMQGVVSRVTAVATANDNRIHYARGLNKTLSDPQITALLSSANAVNAEWQREQDSVAFVMSVLFADGIRPPQTWPPMLRSEERYSVCAARAVRIYAEGAAPDTTCAELRRAAADSLQAFRADAISSRHLASQ